MMKPFYPESILDFHDMGELTSYEIERLTVEFLEDTHALGDDYVLIITGYGKNSPKGPVIKPQVQKILSNNTLVKKFKIAGVENGGIGAFEVELKQ